MLSILSRKEKIYNKEDLSLLKKFLNDSSNFVNAEIEFLSNTIEGLSNDFIYYDLDEIPIKLKRKAKEIVKIRLFEIIEKDAYEPVQKIDLRADQIRNIYIYIRYADQSKEMMLVQKKCEELIFTLLINLKARSYSIYECINNKQLEWKGGIDEHYSEQVDSYYRELDERIFLYIQKILANIGNQVNIIDLGCGNGRFLKMLEEKKIDANFFGVDLSSKNIINAKKNYTGKCLFIEEKMENISQVIKSTKEIDINLPIIFVSMGSMTRKVLPNAFVAAQVLKKLIDINTYTSGKVLAIIGGGLYNTLFTKNGVKRIGFKIIEYQSSASLNRFFHFSPATTDEILKNKIHKIKKSHILDLTLSPDPVKWLNEEKILTELRKINDKITIILSYTELTPKLIKNILKLSMEFDIHWIFQSNNSHDIFTFRKNLLLHYPIIKSLETEYTNNEIHLMATKSCIDTISPKRLFIAKLNEFNQLIILKKGVELISQKPVESALFKQKWIDMCAQTSIKIINEIFIQALIHIANTMKYDIDESAYLFSKHTLGDYYNLLAKILTVSFHENTMISSFSRPYINYQKSKMEPLQANDKKMEPHVSLLFIDQKELKSEEKGTRGRSGGHWVSSRINGDKNRYFLKMENKVIIIARYSIPSNCYTCGLSPNSIFIEALAASIHNTYLPESVPPIAISYDENNNPMLLSKEVKSTYIFEEKIGLETTCRLLTLLLHSKVIADYDTSNENFVGHGKTLQRIDLSDAFSYENDFSMALLNPFELIDKLFTRESNKTKSIGYLFYRVIYHNYNRCLESILDAAINLKNNILNPTMKDIRRKWIKLFESYLPSSDILNIKKNLKCHENNFLSLLKKIPSDHIICKLFPEKWQLLTAEQEKEVKPSVVIPAVPVSITKHSIFSSRRIPLSKEERNYIGNKYLKVTARPRSVPSPARGEGTDRGRAVTPL